MSASRALIILLLAWLALLATATLRSLLPRALSVWMPMPELAFVVVLYIGLSARGHLGVACALAVTIGWLADLFVGAPKGLHMAAYGLTALVAAGASSRIFVSGAVLTTVVSFLFALGHGLAVVLIRASLSPRVGVGGWRLILPFALATAITAPLVFSLLRAVDRRFSRDPRLLGGAPRRGWS